MFMTAIKSRLRSASRSLPAERLRSLAARPAENPLFIFGNQKSGTSAVAGLLGAATGRRAHIDFLGACEPYLTPLLQGDTPLDQFVRLNAWPFSASILKEPSLTFVAPELMDYFGVDKAIFILREPYQNIRSILNRVGLPGDAVDLTSFLDSLPNPTWTSILTGRDLGLEHYDYIQVQAFRWLRSAEIFLAHPDRFVPLRYEDFRADKEGSIRGLAANFGLTITQDFSHLLDHQFQRAGNSAVDPHVFFGKRNHALIAEICGPTAARLGY